MLMHLLLSGWWEGLALVVVILSAVPPSATL